MPIDVDRRTGRQIYRPAAPAAPPAPAWKPADMLAGARDALMASYIPGHPRGNLHPIATELLDNRRFSIIDAAESIMETVRGPGSFEPRGGRHDGFSTVIQALGTMDFPAIMETTISGVSQARASVFLEDLRAITAPLFVPDYKPSAFASVDLSETPIPSDETGRNYLMLVPRATGQSYQLHSLFARLLLSRQVIVNDDRQFIEAALAAFTNAAHRNETKAIATLLEGNPTMEDGVLLFHADRGNTAVATLDAGGLGTVFATLREQPAEAGLASGARPAALVIHPDDEIPLLRLLNDLPDPARPRVVVNPFLGSNASWFAVADPALFPALGRITMEGAADSAVSVSGPTTATTLDPDGEIREYPGIAIGLTHSVGLAPLSAVGIAKFTKT